MARSLIIPLSSGHGHDANDTRSEDGSSIILNLTDHIITTFIRAASPYGTASTKNSTAKILKFTQQSGHFPHCSNRGTSTAAARSPELRLAPGAAWAEGWSHP